MSIRIDDNRPFTEEQKKWLLRDGASAAKDRIKVNDRRFGHLSEEEKDALRERADSDDQKTVAAIEAQMAAEAADFHPEDYAKVLPLDMPSLREALKREGLSDEGDEFAELQLRLLEHYDDQRAAQ